jgi:hypothetical protein
MPVLVSSGRRSSADFFENIFGWIRIWRTITASISLEVVDQHLGTVTRFAKVYGFATPLKEKQSIEFFE